MPLENTSIQEPDFKSDSLITNYQLEADRYCLEDFKDLCQKIGEEQAIDLANQYLQISHQYSKWTEWSLHRWPLLTSYRNFLTGKEAPLEPWPSVFEKDCTLYYPLNIKPGQQEDFKLKQIVELVKGDKLASLTTTLRAIPDEKERALYKRDNCCYVTFSGTFTRRQDNYLVKHTGLICIDFDQLGERRDEIRIRLNAFPFTVMSFISPDGDGLRVLFEMDINSYPQKLYYYHYATTFRKMYGLSPFKMDARYFRISRACYLAHDPNVYINPLFLQP